MKLNNTSKLDLLTSTLYKNQTITYDALDKTKSRGITSFGDNKSPPDKLRRINTVYNTKKKQTMLMDLNPFQKTN